MEQVLTDAYNDSLLAYKLHKQVIVAIVSANGNI